MKDVKISNYANSTIIFTSVVVFAIAVIFRWLFKGDIFGQTFIMLVIFISSFYAWRNINSRKWEKHAKGILIGLATFLFILLILKSVAASHSDTRWDFMPFYVHGLIGINDLPFYSPSSFDVVLEKFNFINSIDHDIMVEVFEQGMLYPPITMLFFSFLALFEYETAQVLLSALIFIFVIASSVALYRLIFKEHKSIFTFLFVLIIVISFPGTMGTVGYHQTNFFILFFLILMLSKIDKPISGVFHAMTIFFKPITALLIFHTFINKRWKNVLLFSATGAVLILITGAIWGFQNILDYFISSPLSRYSVELYKQPINQSLLALFHKNFSVYNIQHNTIHFIYYIVALGMVGITICCSLKLGKKSKILSIFPFIPLMIMLYPSTMRHYMVYLIPLFLWFMNTKNAEKYFMLMILPAAFFLQVQFFYSNMIIWLFFIYYSIFAEKVGIHLFFRSNEEENCSNY